MKSMNVPLEIARALAKTALAQPSNIEKSLRNVNKIFRKKFVQNILARGKKSF